MATNTTPSLNDLTQVFGGLRAEYLHDDIYELFTQPAYWPELLSVRPCLLTGGRGTGKTTVLRGLSYQGQWRLTGHDVSAWDFVGFYWRVDTNAVTAFRGAGVEEEQWSRIFGHYVNLILVEQVATFLVWYRKQTGDASEPLATTSLARICRSLHLNIAPTNESLVQLLKDSTLDLEAYVNNAAGEDPPRLSMQGRPLQLLAEGLRDHAVLGAKPFFFLLDEYENLEDYQQRVVNTLIKHSGTEYTFKVGMRETGHRERATLNPDEQLIEPADYANIDITRRLRQSHFSTFAEKVCNERLAKLGGGVESTTIESLLPGITEMDEARRLGIEGAVRELREALRAEGADSGELSRFDRLDPLHAYLVGYWAESQRQLSIEALRELLADPELWRQRLDNYQYAMLYAIRRRRRGRRKYYAGWPTYAQLAEGNIRYLLQLVAEALGMHLREDRTLGEPVSAELQSDAAVEVGRRNLHELQGLAAEGAQLTRLVLGLGRVFQVMASQPQGHAPEVNQFRVTPSGADGDGAVDALLGAAVMHLAVVRFTADKMAAASAEVKDFDYMLHPIFAPFFTYSHRRKRRLSLTSQELLGIVKEPSASIRSILSKSSRVLEEDDLPVQLQLFKGFYNEPA